MAKKHWIQKADIGNGGLHRALGIPADQKIGAARVAEAERSKNPRIRKMATLAHTFADMRKK